MVGLVRMNRSQPGKLLRCVVVDVAWVNEAIARHVSVAPLSAARVAAILRTPWWNLLAQDL